MARLVRYVRKAVSSERRVVAWVVSVWWRVWMSFSVALSLSSGVGWDIVRDEMLGSFRWLVLGRNAIDC